MHEGHVHSYGLEAASFYLALLFPAALFAAMIAGTIWDDFKRRRHVARLAARPARLSAR